MLNSCAEAFGQQASSVVQHANRSFQCTTRSAATFSTTIARRGRAAEVADGTFRLIVQARRACEVQLQRVSMGISVIDEELNRRVARRLLSLVE